MRIFFFCDHYRLQLLWYAERFIFNDSFLSYRLCVIESCSVAPGRPSLAQCLDLASLPVSEVICRWHRVVPGVSMGCVLPQVPEEHVGSLVAVEVCQTAQQCQAGDGASLRESGHRQHGTFIPQRDPICSVLSLAGYDLVRSKEPGWVRRGLYVTHRLAEVWCRMHGPCRCVMPQSERCAGGQAERLGAGGLVATAV